MKNNFVHKNGPFTKREAVKISRTPLGCSPIVTNVKCCTRFTSWELAQTGIIYVFYSMSVLYGLTSQWNQLTRIPHTGNVQVSEFDIQCISVFDAAGRTVEQKLLDPGFDSHPSH